MNLGTAYAEGVLPGAGRATCNLNVMLLTVRSHVHYMLFAPFAPNQRRHCAAPPALRTARSWARRCCRLNPDSDDDAGASETTDSARFEVRSRCASEMRAAASTMRRARWNSEGFNARVSATAARASTAATTRSSSHGAASADAVARAREAAARHAPQQ